MEQKTPRESLMAEAKTGLMAGKRGLIMGVANDHSIAWGIAQVLAGQGAELAFTYQGDAQAKRLKPLAEGLGSSIVLAADVESDEQLDNVFARIEKEWGGLDFVVHAIAFSDRDELKGRYVDTSRANFNRTLDISCYSFTAVARRACPLMKRGGAMVTLSYLGAQRVMPSYNVMGVAKAALEASVRYLAADLGQNNIRVNAISAGPMRTLAGSAVGDARMVFKWNKTHAPLKRSVDLNHIGGAALYLLSDLSGGVTGEVHFVDAGFNVVGMPPTADLKGWTPQIPEVMGMVMMKQVPYKLTLAAAALAALTGSASADWRDQISDYDAGRLTSLEQSRADAVEQAETRGGTGDFRAIKETFGADAHGVPAQALFGNWHCRQMKLGGMTGYAVFSWFPCRISRVNGGVWFEKLGTQRMAGYLYPDQGGLWVYLGAQSARGEPWHRYSGRFAQVGASTTPDDQVGALVGIGNNALRIDLPTPSTQESDFDAIELVR